MLVTTALAKVRSYLDEDTAGLWLDSEIYGWLSDGQLTYKIEEQYTNTDLLTNITKIAVPNDVLNILTLTINDNLYEQHALGETNLITYGFHVHDEYIVLDYEVATIAIGDLIIDCLIHPAVIELDGETLDTSETQPLGVLTKLAIPDSFCIGIVYYATAQAYLKDEEMGAHDKYFSLYLMQKSQYEEYGLKAEGELKEDSYTPEGLEE